MPPATYDCSSFGATHFGNARLGDKRRQKSLVDLANRFHRHPQGSLPNKLKDPNALRRLYDLMNTRAVTHAAVFRSHARNTGTELLRHIGIVLRLHDTTELDFTFHRSLHDELGQIGDGRGRGYECHNSLVYLPKERKVLGLLAQQLHVRADAPKGETPAQRRERENRESLLWTRGVEASRQVLEEVCRAEGRDGLPDGLMVIDVCDRGGDTFEFLDYEDSQNQYYVVRSKHNRTILLEGSPGGKRAKLHGHLRTLPEQGRREITVHGHDGEPERQATVAISWAEVVLEPPHQHCGYSRRKPLKVWALRVWELKPPKEAEPVEWFVLTNVPVTSLADAWERVDTYCCRWVVEEFHKAQKTGCDIELPQFETAAALQPMIALLSVVAVGLLNLRERSRDPELQETPACDVMPAEEVEVMSGWRYGEKRDLTVREFYLGLARLGGHQNRRNDRPPGWLVLWRGWQALQLMVTGARAAACPEAAGPPRERKPNASQRNQRRNR